MCLPRRAPHAQPAMPGRPRPCSRSAVGLEFFLSCRDLADALAPTYCIRLRGPSLSRAMRSYLLPLLMCAALCAPAMVVGQATAVFSEADRLRGSYGPYRANNDLL